MGRVISYGEKTGYNDGDYLLLDNGESGTKRIRADRVGIQLDPTLTVPNKAAPANAVKAVGDNLNAITNGERLTFSSGYIQYDSYPDVTTSSNYVHAVSSCAEGDVFVVSGSASASARIWAFYDANNNRLNLSSDTSSGDGIVLIAPENAVTFVTNSKVSFGDYKAYKIAKTQIRKNTDDTFKNALGYEMLPLMVGYINTSGSTVNIFAASVLPTYKYVVDECTEGDEYVINGNGGGSARLWCFIDSDNNVLQVAADGLTTASNYISLIAPENAVKFIANMYASSPNPVVFKRSYSASDLITTQFYEDDFKIGRYSVTSPAKYTFTNVFACTKDFVPEYIKGFAIQNPNIRLAILIYKKDGTYHGNNYWNTVNKVFIFNHATYNYKFYLGASTDQTLFDISSVLDNITVYVDRTKYLKLYNDVKHKNTMLQNQVNGLASAIKGLMKNNYDILYANAKTTIDLKNYTGNTQNVHPKVLYFPNLFGQHYFWMAYTPYPFSSDRLENPCIAYSDDGYKWYDASNNPLSDPQGDGYNSDTHLVYREDTGVLECWYRYVSDTSVSPVHEVIKRRTTTDGVTWTEEETVYDNSTGAYASLLSPAIIFDGTNYNIWVVNNDNHTIDFYTAPSSSVSTWTKVRSISLNYTDGNGVEYNPWHLDVIQENGNYIICMMCKSKTGSVWTLFMTTSSDNITYTTPYVVMYGSENGWDVVLYRSSIVNVDGEYRIYYSAGNQAYGSGQGGNVIYGMGISTSNSLTDFIGDM